MSSYGFDNIAGVLKLSPTLMERYLVGGAEGEPRSPSARRAPTPTIDYFRVADDLSQDGHLPGLPLGTRGGTRMQLRVPDGRASTRFRPRLTRDLNESVPLYTERQELEISIDGERVGVFTLPRRRRARRPRAPPPAPAPPPRSIAGAPAPAPQRPAISQIAPGVRAQRARSASRATAPTRPWNLRVPVKAGQREVVVTFLNRTVGARRDARACRSCVRIPPGVNIPETRLGRVPAQRRDRRPARSDRRRATSPSRDGASSRAAAAGSRRGRVRAARSSRRWRAAPTAVR